jgi:anti-sigma regulatory factor (Ser/Thr protein kinase)
MSTPVVVGTTLTLSPQQVSDWLAGTVPSGLADTGRRTWRPVSFAVPALKRSVPLCRRLSRLWLDAQCVDDQDARDMVLLVVSELVSNAVVHSASARVTCRLGRSGNCVLVEVSDQGRAASVPFPARPARNGIGGRGLAIVAELAAEWGVRREAGACTVWAAVPAEDGTVRASGARPAVAAHGLTGWLPGTAGWPAG